MIVKEIKSHDTKKSLVTDDAFDEKSQWEILEYEIQKFSVRYSKVIAKKKRNKLDDLET